jgi:hypothetical protein
MSEMKKTLMDSMVEDLNKLHSQLETARNNNDIDQISKFVQLIELKKAEIALWNKTP